ncbi:unnamed protein product [Amoebophrya sp. A25]|nr:unnamed protein product [Amoebophrya sp. A25]|eukprot:GSA25T00001629001.1
MIVSPAGALRCSSRPRRAIALASRTPRSFSSTASLRPSSTSLQERARPDEVRNLTNEESSLPLNEHALLIFSSGLPPISSSSKRTRTIARGDGDKNEGVEDPEAAAVASAAASGKLVYALAGRGQGGSASSSSPVVLEGAPTFAAFTSKEVTLALATLNDPGRKQETIAIIRSLAKAATQETSIIQTGGGGQEVSVSRADLLIRLCKIGNAIQFSSPGSSWSAQDILACLRLYSEAGCLCVPLFRKAMMQFLRMDRIEREQSWEEAYSSSSSSGSSSTADLVPAEAEHHTTCRETATSATSSSSTTTLTSIDQEDPEALLYRRFSAPYYRRYFSVNERVALLRALARQRARVLVPRLAREFFPPALVETSSSADSDIISSASSAEVGLSVDQAVSILESCSFLRMPLPVSAQKRVMNEVERIRVRELDESIVDRNYDAGKGTSSSSDDAFLIDVMYHTLTSYHSQPGMNDLPNTERVPLRRRAQQHQLPAAAHHAQLHELLSVEYIFDTVLPTFARRCAIIPEQLVPEEGTPSTSSASPLASLSHLSLRRANVVRSIIRYLHPEFLQEMTNNMMKQDHEGGLKEGRGETAADRGAYLHVENNMQVIEQALKRIHEACSDADRSSNATSTSASESESISAKTSRSCNSKMELNFKQQVVPGPRFLSTVDWSLTKLRIAHSVSHRKGPFIVDFVERDRRCVYRCLRQDQWLAESLRFTIAPKVVEEKTLKAMGYRVINIPYWHWNKLQLRKTRIEYLRMSRYLALMDPRGRDGLLQERSYVGEFFGPRDVPKTPMGWFKPKEARPLAE